MTDARTQGIGGLTGRILLFVLLGFPLLAYLWETLNELLSGSVNGRRLLVSVPVLVLFGALLVWLSRTVRRWGEARADAAPSPLPHRRPR